MKYFHQLVRDERGLATAEYAVATVAACGFGGVLLKILGSATVTELLTDLLRRALGLVM
jgi:Flp pilus assembly pilin Flp